MVCSNWRGEEVPWPDPDMGYVVYTVQGRDGNNHVISEVRFAAFDPVHQNVPDGLYRWLDIPIEDDLSSEGVASAETLPCIARTPGDSVHLVWQRPAVGQTPGQIRYSTFGISPSRVRQSYVPAPSTPWQISEVSTPVAVSPFVEAWGDSAFVVWSASKTIDSSDVRRKGKAVWRPFDRWRDVANRSETPGTPSEWPTMSTRAAITWSEDWINADCRFEGDPGGIAVYSGGIVHTPSSEVQLVRTLPPWPTTENDISRVLFTEELYANACAVRFVSHARQYTATGPHPYYTVTVGNSAPSPFCLFRSGCASYGTHKVDYADQELKYGLGYLNPAYHHALRLQFYREGAATCEMQVGLADSAISSVTLPPGVLETLWVDIPQQFCPSGNVELGITRSQGPSAVLAGLEVYEYEDFQEGGGGGAQSASSWSPRPARATLSARNPSTIPVRISYGLPWSSPTSLVIYDLAGNRVRILESRRGGVKRPGSYFATWDGEDSRGRLLPSGIYFCRLETDRSHVSAKIVLTR
jgi:hypothetical protein